MSKVTLAQLFVGVKTCSAIERQAVNEWCDGGVAGFFAAVVSGAGVHLELRIAARAIDPGVDDALLPVGKTIRLFADGVNDCRETHQRHSDIDRA